jgi:hypothetical protein
MDEIERVFRQTHAVPDWFDQLLPWWKGWFMAATVWEEIETAKRMRAAVDEMIRDQLARRPITGAII